MTDQSKTTDPIDAERRSDADLARTGATSSDSGQGAPPPADGETSTADLAVRPAGSTDEMAASRTVPAGPREGSNGHEPLFDEGRSGELRSRWDEVQGGFVDEPRRSVQQADALVAEVMQTLAQTFAAERRSLEGQWTRGDDVSTEELRVALRRYRAFFDRLLAI